MPPNMAITSGNQNPHWKHGIKMSRLFLRVSYDENGEEMT
jgi:hypothetical protein